MKMSILIRELIHDDLDQTISLWSIFPEVDLTLGDSKEDLSRYLHRNKGLSFVACDGNSIVGAILAGHDGRRGYAYHLAVRPEYQRRGIGSELFSRTLDALWDQGIRKCHAFVYRDNAAAGQFLAKHGFNTPKDFVVFTNEIP